MTNDHVRLLILVLLVNGKITGIESGGLSHH